MCTFARTGAHLPLCVCVFPGRVPQFRGQIRVRPVQLGGIQGQDVAAQSGPEGLQEGEEGGDDAGTGRSTARLLYY